MQASQGCVEIPTFGLKNSLNVAAAAPVVVFEVLRQWGAMDGSGGPVGAAGDS
jgi:tRNA(Leu) C34 or U34 (ribose-2'-O)-methylase TrmL